MGANPSSSTLYAVELVKSGVTPIDAAALAGIHHDTLYKNKDYKAWKKKQKKLVK